MEQATQATVAEVVKQVAAAMSDAVKQYGPDAVDLAMLAYRVEAAQQLLHGVVFVAVAAGLVAAFLKFWAWSGSKMDGSYNDEGLYIGRAVSAVVGGGVTAMSAASAAVRLFDVSAWLAALGHPELRVAMKALEAAGLL
jgi:hypothetical protein